MPTNRTPRHRSARRRITPEAVVLYIRARETADLYRQCVRGQGCGSTRPGMHCPTCRDHIDACRELGRLLDVMPWETCPLNVDGPEPPDYMLAGHFEPQADGWRKSWALRCLLEEAADQQ